MITEAGVVAVRKLARQLTLMNDNLILLAFAGVLGFRFSDAKKCPHTAGEERRIVHGHGSVCACDRVELGRKAPLLIAATLTGPAQQAGPVVA